LWVVFFLWEGLKIPTRKKEEEILKINK